MDSDSILVFLDQVFEAMVKMHASDAYITVGCPLSVRVGDDISPFNDQVIEEEDMELISEALLNDDRKKEFQHHRELNFALHWKKSIRFRVNFFYQRQHIGIVIRRIRTDIPTPEMLGLTEIYNKLVMHKKGLVLVTGPAGSGKSSSLAAMLGERNHHGSGHILTIEDPIEFIHEHDKCIITQREVGLDTHSLDVALRNALRQRPDVVVIGEIRSAEAMHQAIHFAESGQLCLATLHSTNTTQAVERIVSFFPEEQHHELFITLSNVLLAILSQRLVNNLSGGKTLISEVITNIGLVHALLQEGKIEGIADALDRNLDPDMQSFDQALFRLYMDGMISQEIALMEADRPSNLKLKMAQHDAGGVALGEETDFVRKHQNILSQEL